MAGNYANLLTTIAANIKAGNNDHQTTGADVEAAIDGVVSSLIAGGYLWKGIATPTSPGSAQTPDERVFYLATTAGTYTYLGGLVVNAGEAAILYWDTAWHKVNTGIPLVSVSQNTETGHDKITIGGVDYETASVEDVSQLGLEVGDNINLPITINKICNQYGDIVTYNGWAITEKFEVKTGYVYKLATNTLNYNINVARCFDASGNHLGHVTIGANSTTADYLLSVRPTTKYVIFNLHDDGTHGTLTPEDAALLLFSVENNNNIKKSINELSGEVSSNEYDINQEKGILGVYPIYFLKNKVTTNSSGIDSPANYNGYATTDIIDVTEHSLESIRFNKNSLSYIMYNAVCFDSNKDYLGIVTLNGTNYENEVPLSYITGLRPTTKYIRINLYNGTTHPTLTDDNTADFNVFHKSSGIFTDVETLKKEVADLTPKKNVILTYANIGSAKYISVLSELSERYNIANRGIWRDDENYTYNPCFNYWGTDIISKSDQSVVTINSEQDNITAVNAQVGYIGANHGLYPIFIISVASHGKTYADIGSEWIANGIKWYIIRIVDSDNLVVVSEYYDTGGPRFYDNLSNGDTLVHSSGASHTGAMTITGIQDSQWRPSLDIVKQELYLDNVLITDYGTYEGNVVDFVEVYDVISPASYLDKLKSLVGTLTENPLPKDYADLDKWYRYSNVYRFTIGGCNVLFNDLIALDEVTLNLYAPLDIKPMIANSLGGRLDYYLPKGLPITINNKVFDYRTPKEFDYSESVKWTPEYWENPLLPPDRGIEFVTDEQYKRIIGLHHGYIFNQGIGGEIRKDYCNDAWWINNTGAVYNGALQGAKVGYMQEFGKCYSFVAFRKYEDVSELPNGVVSNSQFVANGVYYIYLDFDAAGTYHISIPSEYYGKKIEVFEKSDNVIFAAEIATSDILFKVGSALPMYGYLVACIKA